MSRANHALSNPKPFLRWAGGKTRLARTLRSLAPATTKGVYWEPFLGAGSLFFALTPERAVLSDLNSTLVDCFRAVRDHPRQVSEHLLAHASRTSKDYYYRVRLWYNQNQGASSAERAAAFIYLNKTCFNGIWRVNRKGEFNVPYGHKEPPALPSRDDLEAASSALKPIELRTGDYQEIVREASSGDFVYLDPPYPPLSTTANFTHYTRERFGAENHKTVADTMRALHGRGCRVLVSNADTEFIRELYDGFMIIELKVTRWISADGQRNKAKEIAIMNYQPATPVLAT